MELISIIVPVFNVDDEIKKCIMSLCNQTYSNIEIVIVDDGSKETIGKKIDNIAEIDSRIRVFHTENQGAAKARLEGVAKSNGELIMFCDADDYYEQDACESLYYWISKYNCDVAIGAYRKHKLNGEIHDFFGTEEEIRMSNDEMISCMLHGKYFTGALWGKLYRKSVFPRIFPFSIKINEDILLNYEFFYNALSGVYVDHITYNYVERNNSLCHTTKRVQANKDALWVAEKIYKSSITKPYNTIATERLVRVLLNRIVLLVINKEIKEANNVRRDLKKLDIKKQIESKSLKFRAYFANFSLILYCLFYLVYDKIRKPKWDL